jgi:cellulose 1,4-beta-cellobiosidase
MRSSAPGRYPCANSGLPLQTSKLTSVTTSWSTTQVSSGFHDVAYDIWFNSTPTTSGQPDGTELMIWLNSYGGVYPFGSQTATTSIAGMNWNIWTGQQSSWKIISYILNPGGSTFSNLNVLALIQDAVSRGSVNPAHYLIGAEAGFEVWQGGQGLGTNSFSFSASASGTAPTATPSSARTAAPTATPTKSSTPTKTPTATPTAAPTATPSGSAKCSATYAVSSSWNNGFTANVTVANTGTTAIKSWKVAWTWPGTQAVANAWNATIAATGKSVTAANASSNGTVSGGGNTSFGFQASYSGTNTNPALTCSAT